VAMLVAYYTLNRHVKNYVLAGPPQTTTTCTTTARTTSTTSASLNQHSRLGKS